MASVFFNNQSGVNLYCYDGSRATGPVGDGGTVPVTILNPLAYCGWLIKTSFTGIVYVKAAAAPYALQISAYRDSPIGDLPTGNTGDTVNWTNNSSATGGQVTWIIKIPGSTPTYGGAILGAGGNTSQQLPTAQGYPGFDPKARWGWRVQNFTGRLLFALNGLNLTADNQTS